MEIILRSNKNIHSKKIALFNCLKDIEKGKLEPSEEENKKRWESIRN